MDDAAAPLLLFVVGPPAVGKMSVGQAIAERVLPHRRASCCYPGAE